MLPGRTRTLHGSSLAPSELIAEADVEHTGHDRVDPILPVRVRQHLHAGGHLDPDHVESRLGGVTNDVVETDRRWEDREWLPIDVLGQDRSETRLRLAGPARLIVIALRLPLTPSVVARHPLAACGHVFPVAAKIALHTAGATVDVPGSPIPPGVSVLGTM